MQLELSKFEIEILDLGRLLMEKKFHIFAKN